MSDDLIDLESFDDDDTKSDTNASDGVRASDVRVSTTLQPGTFMGRLPPNHYHVVPSSHALPSSTPSHRTVATAEAPSSPPFQRRHKAPHRGVTHDAPSHRGVTMPMVEAPSSSTAVSAMTVDLSRLQLEDFENQEHLLPEKIPEDILVRILGELELFVTSLLNFDTYQDLISKWMTIRRKLFKTDPSNMEPFDINLEYEQILMMMNQLRLKFMQMELIQDDATHEPASSYTYTSRFARLFEIVYNLRTMLVSRLRLSELSDPNKHYEMGQFRDYVDPGYFSYLRFDGLTPFQKFLLYVINQASIRRYRKRWQEFKRHGIVDQTICLYEQVFTDDGHPTHAWRKKMSLEVFVHSLTDMNTNFEMWSLFTKVRGMMGAILQHIKMCDYLGLPELKRQRHMFAFSNGIYDARQLKFFTYDNPIPSTVVCANYFKTKFDTNLMSSGEQNPHNISTPPLDLIFDAQNIPKDAQLIIWGLMGRYYHELNVMEKWKVALMTIGMPQTGKSTLATFKKRTFDDEDVGIINSDMEKQFGISGFADCFMAICFEVSTDFRLTHTQMQSMIDGESISFARKYLNSAKQEWIAHLDLNGNLVPPNWNEYGGNIGRRLPCVVMNNNRITVQTDLDDQLEQYRGNIMHKCNLAYHLMVREYGSKSLWNEDQMPKYFYETREMLTLTIAPIQAFIETSGMVEITKNYNDFIGWSEFVVALNQFCHERSFRPQRWTPQLCVHTFLRFGLVDDGHQKIHNIKLSADFWNKQTNRPSVSRSQSMQNFGNQEYDPDTSV